MGLELENVTPHVAQVLDLTLLDSPHIGEDDEISSLLSIDSSVYDAVGEEDGFGLELQEAGNQDQDRGAVKELLSMTSSLPESLLTKLMEEATKQETLSAKPLSLDLNVRILPPHNLLLSKYLLTHTRTHPPPPK